MTYEVVLTKKAEDQLSAAADWYRREAPHVVDAWFNGFVELIISLEENPKRFAEARESKAFPFKLRQMLYGFGRRRTHRALFVVYEDRVVVHAIRHLSQRDLDTDDLINRE